MQLEQTHLKFSKLISQRNLEQYQIQILLENYEIILACEILQIEWNINLIDYQIN